MARINKIIRPILSLRGGRRPTKQSAPQERPEEFQRRGISWQKDPSPFGLGTPKNGGLLRFARNDILIGLLLSFLWAVPALAQFQDPQCRTFHFKGGLQLPEGAAVPTGLELNVTYQLNFQKSPAVLLTNYPLTTRDFEITFTNLRDLGPTEAEKLRKKLAETQPSTETRASTETQASEEAATSLGTTQALGETKPSGETQPSPITQLKFFTPTMFLYPREIRFQYYLRNRAKGSTSPLQTVDFFHERKEIDGVARCESEISLSPLVPP